MRFLTQNATTTATIRWLDAARTRWGPYNAPPPDTLPGFNGRAPREWRKQG